MCGIAGILSKYPISNRETLDRMRDTMTHRGPDGAGTWWADDGTVGLAHRRLSILDLTAAGNQPMQTTDGRYAITFNGEIYNHEELRIALQHEGCSFQSRSDTEVLLHAWILWGDACLARIRGMFSFVFVDTLRGEAVLVRDRAGEKPLFWGKFGDRFLFASELKAILSDSSIPRRLDFTSLDSYLAYGYVPRDLCLLSGINKVLPGYIVRINWRTGSVSNTAYWQLPPPLPEKAPVDIQELVSKLESLLESAVKEQLCADVPVGVMLSGGMDSSIITAIARRVYGGRLRTFTIGNQGNPAYDERGFARNISKAFGTEHTELDAGDFSLSLLHELVRQFDEPMCDSSMIPTLMLSRLIRGHCVVAIGGDGGDELFGGYNRYQGFVRREGLRANIPSMIRTGVSWVATKYMPIGMGRRNGLMGLAGSQANGFACDGGFFSKTERAELCPMLAQSGALGTAESFKISMIEPDRDVPGAAMAVDFYTYLPDDILVKVDRAGMLPSLEIRAPFLDRRIVEFAFANVPNRLRANGTEKKILLRKLAQKLLPANHNLNRKQGFSIPLGDWIDAAFIEKHIISRASVGPFDAEALKSLCGRLSLRDSNSERLFCLMLLLAWMEEYKVSC